MVRIERPNIAQTEARKKIIDSGPIACRLKEIKSTAPNRRIKREAKDPYRKIFHFLGIYFESIVVEMYV